MKKLLCAALALVSVMTACSKGGDRALTRADLEGKTVGVVNGTTAESLADALDPEEILYYRSVSEAAEALKDGDIFAIIYDTEPAKRLAIQDEELEVLADPAVDPLELVCAVKKGDYELLGLINAVLAEKKNNGTIDDLASSFISFSGNPQNASVAASAGEVGTLTLGTVADTPPFSYKDGEGYAAGFDIALAELIAERAGMALSVKIIKNSEINSAITSGEVDFVMSGLTADEGNARYVDYSDVYYTSKQSIIILKGR